MNNIITAAAKPIIISPPDNLVIFAASLPLAASFEPDFELVSGAEIEEDDPVEVEAELGDESVDEVVVLESDEPASLKIFASGESGGRFNIAANVIETAIINIIITLKE